MRTISDREDRLLDSGNYARHIRVFIQDADATWQDMTTLAGHDWVVGATWGAQVDQPVGNATVELVRAHGKLSLALLDERSKLNKVDGSYSPLVHPGRAIKIEVALTLPFGSPVESQWLNVFEGRIDKVSWGSSPVVLQCRDKAGEIQKTFVEWEWVFGESGHHAPIWIWEPSTAVVTARDGQVYYCLPPTPNGCLYIPNAYGTTGTTEPTWRTDTTPFSDGTHSWVKVASYDATAGERLYYVIENILSYPNAYDDFGGMLLGSLSSWYIKPYRQQRTSCLEAVRNLAQQIGWDLRMKWSATHSAWRLSLYEPDRDNTTADRTFGPNNYKSINNLDLSSDGVRNVVRVVYTNSSATMPNGVDHPRAYVQQEDSSSIAKYGRQFCEIAEASTSQIDTATEATALAAAVLSDLSEPSASQAVSMGLFPFVEIGDLYAFSPNGVHYSSEQKLAVVGFQHTFRDGKAWTDLQCRGKPSGGFLTWHKRLAMPGLGQPRNDLPPPAPTSVSVSNYMGCSVVTMVPPGSRWADAELYVSASSGFTPSSSTLESRGRTTTWTVSRNGGTYYGRIVIRDDYGNASQPSPQFTLSPIEPPT